MKILIAIILLSATAIAQAGTATAQMGVSVTIVESCSLSYETVECYPKTSYDKTETQPAEIKVYNQETQATTTENNEENIKIIELTY